MSTPVEYMRLKAERDRMRALARELYEEAKRMKRDFLAEYGKTFTDEEWAEWRFDQPGIAESYPALAHYEREVGER